MAGLSKSDYEAYLKEWYPGTNADALTYEDRPLVGILPKNTSVRGTGYPKPVRFTNTAGRSASYAKAHANQTPANRAQWFNTHADNYSKATVYNKTIELSAGNDAAFREALTDEVDAAYGAFSDDLHFEMFGTGSGARGLCAAGTTATVLQLGSGQARWFEKDMVLQKGTLSALHNSGEERVVTEVDRDADTVTVASGWTTAAASGHYIYASGDFGVKANGLAAWVPTAAGLVANGGAAPDTFLTVDRTPDGARLAGVEGVAGSTSGLEVTESLINSAARGQREGARPNAALLHPDDFARLSLETEQRGRYAKVYSTTGDISYDALVIHTPAGSIPVISDPGQPADTAYLLDMRRWELFSAGALPSMFDKDGNFYHREETADTLAFYLYGFYNLQTQAPGRHVYISDLGY